MKLPMRLPGQRSLLALGALGSAVWLGRYVRGWRHQRAALRTQDDGASIALPEPATWPRLPSVSVLVAAWNEADNIERHLRGFEQLRYPARQLVLCAGGGDRTLELARAAAGANVVLLEQQPGEGKQAALRRCFAQATGEVIVLTDADCDFSDAAFERLIEPIARGVGDVATGSCEPLTHQRGHPLVRCQWFGDRLHASSQPQYAGGVHGRNSALRRHVVQSTGAFDAEARTGTDYVLSQTLRLGGFPILAIPSSRVASEYPSSPRAYVQMWRRWNKNLLLHGIRYDAWGDVHRVLIGASVAGATGLSLLLAPLLGPTALLTFAALWSMATLNRLRRICLGATLAGEHVSPRVLATTPLLAGLDMAAVLLALYDALVPGRRTRW